MFGFKKKAKPITIEYDPVTQYPVLHCSICTGETVAGFKNRNTKKFTEVLLIRTPADLERFKQNYGLDGEIPKEY